ncbi:hypothetical protein HRR83_003521 [Exophiala dermatitidis]|uniref:Uncharacterized protein n=2 Tax=Exophiala dermatitidis TaxID=5970 RepID=H6BLM3_EXODN|nr:uncharacterized protein HMPREF1120_00139 [Exophiala dermatitidis NIH/UT8656]KAJ4514591.1 hypothetical protein HRR75_003955 [Exophiala dermatitidis]EHY51916.1 hypothetical protein HMPREF1120_00139 [Exophiala dermatitidis NIH/UT8656]KAJ4518022.1 hypothetical protein HRR74_004317 [Exophiala dermatitidis]KAJ4520921.1 hypothetical protein HRR73_003262 [Exophiala dermatitidis]KAJ4546059.1 hypothetical protein HRR78_005898 [Exophiala dermatitidis]
MHANMLAAISALFLVLLGLQVSALPLSVLSVGALLGSSVPAFPVASWSDGAIFSFPVSALPVSALSSPSPDFNNTGTHVADLPTAASTADHPATASTVAAGGSRVSPVHMAAKDDPKPTKFWKRGWWSCALSILRACKWHAADPHPSSTELITVYQPPSSLFPSWELVSTPPFTVSAATGLPPSSDPNPITWSIVSVSVSARGLSTITGTGAPVIVATTTPAATPKPDPSSLSGQSHRGPFPTITSYQY